MAEGPNEKDGLEVTPAMIEAGFALLKNSGVADEYLEADKLLVAEIFAAMSAVSGREVWIAPEESGST